MHICSSPCTLFQEANSPMCRVTSEKFDLLNPTRGLQSNASPSALLFAFAEGLASKACQPGAKLVAHINDTQSAIKAPQDAEPGLMHLLAKDAHSIRCFPASQASGEEIGGLERPENGSVPELAPVTTCQDICQERGTSDPGTLDLSGTT